MHGAQRMAHRVALPVPYYTVAHGAQRTQCALSIDWLVEHHWPHEGVAHSAQQEATQSSSHDATARLANLPRRVHLMRSVVRLV
jgi:hypothetical protein